MASPSQATQDRARALVYPIASNLRALDSYLVRRCRGYDGRGALVVELTATLERCEKLARSMFDPSYEGL